MSTDTTHSAGKIENLKSILLLPIRFKCAENFFFHLSNHAHLTSLADFFGASLEIIVFSLKEGRVFPYKW